MMLEQLSTVGRRPLPPAALAAARRSVQGRGFHARAILEDYALHTSAGKLVVDALAFAHPTRRDLAGHAALTVTGVVDAAAEEALVRIAAESTAPFHLVHRRDRFSLHATSAGEAGVVSRRLRADVGYDGLEDALSDFGADLEPSHLANVKQGLDAFVSPELRDLRPVQLSLWVEGVTRRLLRERFVAAIQILRKPAGGAGRRKLPGADVTKLAVQMLAAIVLADTGAFGDPRKYVGASLGTLLGTAGSAFPRYFSEALFESHDAQASAAYDLLRGLGYAAFTPDMLTDLYNAAFDDDARRKLGRYDTPLYLTRRIWECIPVELLPPEKRVVADMTCGWGSFLVAGYERLGRLTDMDGRLLREHLHGNDRDKFTSELAALALLLTASDDSWHVEHGDARRWEWLRNHRPGVIVGNPPFDGNRKTEGPEREDRHQKANAFLEYAIERLAPEGYLAMLMPRSFSVAESSPRVRRSLLERCDLLEIWELPRGVFQEAKARTTAIFARKKAGAPGLTSAPVRVRTIQTGMLPAFQRDGRFTSSTVAVDQARWNAESRKSKGSRVDHLFDYKLVLDEPVWARIQSRCKSLGDVADITQGCIPGDPERGNWHDYEHPKRVKWLPDARSALARSFKVDYRSASTIRYPNDLQWPRKDAKHPEKDWERALAGTKVLMVAVVEPGWDLQVKVAVERQGHFVPDNFMVLVPKRSAPKPPVSVEVIAAVLSHALSKAWLIEFVGSLKAPVRALRTLPFPELSEAQQAGIEAAVRTLESVLPDDERGKLLEREARATLHTLLTTAYGLDGEPEAARRLDAVARWDASTCVSLDPPLGGGDSWEVCGRTKRVDAASGKVTLWLEGFEGEHTVPIHAAMPGWVLRNGAEFITRVPDAWWSAGAVVPAAGDWGPFRPQPRTYMSEAEILEGLAKIVGQP